MVAKCHHRNSLVSDVKLNLLVMETTLNYNITNGFRSLDVTSSSNSAVLLAIVGLSVYGTNSLSNCRICNMAFTYVNVIFRPHGRKLTATVGYFPSTPVIT